MSYLVRVARVEPRQTYELTCNNVQGILTRVKLHHEQVFRHSSNLLVDPQAAHSLLK